MTAQTMFAFLDERAKRAKRATTAKASSAVEPPLAMQLQAHQAPAGGEVRPDATTATTSAPGTSRELDHDSEDAYRRGYAEATRSLAAAFEAERASLEDSNAELRLRLAAFESVEQAFASLKNEIGDQVSAILAPFLSKRALSTTIEAFTETVSRLNGSDGDTIRFRGPGVALAFVEQTMGERGAYFVDENSELVADIGALRVETRLRAWIETLRGLAGTEADV